MGDKDPKTSAVTAASKGVHLQVAGRGSQRRGWNPGTWMSEVGVLIVRPNAYPSGTFNPLLFF